MKRVLGIVLFGIGIAIAVFAAALKFYVTPIALNIPYDLEPSTTIAEASNGQHINTSNGVVESSTLRSFTWVVPQPVLTRDKLTGDLADTAVIWDVYSQIVDTATGEVLQPSSEEIALDRKSGAVVAWDGAWSNSSGTREKNSTVGHSYKLPFNAEQTTYPYWDGTLNRTLDLTYAATEQFSGLEAYRYEQAKVEEKIAWDADQLGLLRLFFGDGDGDADAEDGDVYYSVQRTIWVEPVTGQYLNVKQSVQVVFKSAVAANNKTMLAGDFEYTDETKADSAAGVKSNRDLIILVSQTLPLYGGAAGGFFFLVGVILIAVGGKKKAAAPAPAAATAS